MTKLHSLIIPIFWKFVFPLHLNYWDLTLFWPCLQYGAYLLPVIWAIYPRHIRSFGAFFDVAQSIRNRNEHYFITDTFFFLICIIIIIAYLEWYCILFLLILFLSQYYFYICHIFRNIWMLWEHYLKMIHHPYLDFLKTLTELGNKELLWK